jgi:hypothetical protein
MARCAARNALRGVAARWSALGPLHLDFAVLLTLDSPWLSLAFGVSDFFVFILVVAWRGTAALSNR